VQMQAKQEELVVDVGLYAQGVAKEHGLTT
jgi:hypothetical protein